MDIRPLVKGIDRGRKPKKKTWHELKEDELNEKIDKVFVNYYQCCLPIYQSCQLAKISYSRFRRHTKGDYWGYYKNICLKKRSERQQEIQQENKFIEEFVKEKQGDVRLKDIQTHMQINLMKNYHVNTIAYRLKKFLNYSYKILKKEMTF